MPPQNVKVIIMAFGNKPIIKDGLVPVIVSWHRYREPRTEMLEPNKNRYQLFFKNQPIYKKCLLLYFFNLYFFYNSQN